jgi:uncharacterized damage-inducible protein DinB
MTIAQRLLPEFDHEMGTTRRTLERVPNEKWEWRPHPKSSTMGWLAGHLANIPTWANRSIEQDQLDIAPEGKPLRGVPIASREKVLETFDHNVAAARAAIANASDEHLGAGWTLISNGRPVFTQPRAAVLRSFVMNHMIHHRAQLGVYLRLNDIPVPASYGPSADES